MTPRITEIHGGNHDPYPAESALDDLFQTILEVLGDTDVFSHSDSPSVFVVYAHDNNDEGTSNAWCVHRFIDWLRVIRSRTLSDKSPLPLWSTRESGSDAIRNILDNQFCLLPSHGSVEDGNKIGSVDKILLHGSEVLERYYGKEFTTSYVDAIKSAYAQWHTESSDQLVLRQEINKIVEARCHHDSFHHILTEFAFLELRSTYGPGKHGIIPVSLHYDLMEYLPFRDNCDLVLKLKSAHKIDLHKLFFKLLEQLYADEHVLITQFLSCYDQTSKILQQDAALTLSSSQRIINQEILRAQRILKGLGNAAFRNVRLEQEREQHRNATRDIRDMQSKYQRLLAESDMARTKLGGDKLKEVLQWLSSCPFKLHHKSVFNALMPGSGTQLVAHSVYQDWLQLRYSSVLLLHGVRGCGKSSMLSVAIDHLLSGGQDDTRGSLCAYHYCAYLPSEPDRASPNAILRSILRQLAIDQENATIAPKVLAVYEKLLSSAGTDRVDLAALDIQDCVKLILELTMSTSIYIAIDAIDELKEEHRCILVDALQRIVKESNSVIKLLLTSRDDAQIEGLVQSATQIRISPADNEVAIEAFVGAELDKAIRSRSLLNGFVSMSLAEKIRKVLVARAGEMFLWVQLQMKALCHKKTEGDLIATLETGLTGELDTLYEETYETFLAMDNTAKAVVQCVFSWILFSKAPLTLEVMRCAVLKNPYLPRGSGDMVLPDLLDICYNLIILDPVTGTIRACHASVSDYMRRKELFSVEFGNRLLAASCIQQCMEGLSPPMPFPEVAPIEDFSLYAGLYWPEHLGAAQNANINPDSAPQPLSQFILGAGDGRDGGAPSLAFIMWLEWVEKFSQTLPRYHILRRTLETVNSPDGPSPIFTACVFGLRDVLNLILSQMSDVDLEQRSNTGHTPVYLACAFGHNSVVSKLIKHKVDTDVICGSFGNPLQVACFRGHVDVVKNLLAHGVSPQPSTAFRGAFQAACEGCSEDVAMALVKEGQMIEDQEDYNIALQEAAEAGFRDVVDYLMGSDVVKGFGQDVANKNFSQQVLGAIKQGHVSVLRSFLHSHPDIATNIQEDAMAVAALHGRVEMLSFLRDLGMDMDVEGKFGSALRSASLMGDERAVCMLLGWGADAKAVGKRGDCLQAAARKGHIRIMELLILGGADVNQKSKPFGTCIQAAAYHGHIEAVKYLLEMGAEMYPRGKYEDALHAAASGGHDEIASLLLERGYRAPDNRKWAVMARGDRDSRRFWYNQDVILDQSDANDGTPQRSRSPCPEDEETDDEPVSYKEEPEYAGEEKENKYGLVFAATIGNIPIIREFLQAPECDERQVGDALDAAAAKGKIVSIDVLLEYGLRHVDDPKWTVGHALIGAARQGQVKSAQTLTAWLDGTINIEIWAAALQAAAETGHQGVVTEVLTLKCLPPLSTETLERYEFDDFNPKRDEEVPPTALGICKDAIESANASGHAVVAMLLWDWILQVRSESTEANIQDWTALSMAAASFADSHILDACINLERGCLNQENKPASSLSELLSAASEGKNDSTFDYLLALVEEEDTPTIDIMPVFIEVCRQGFDAGALKMVSSINIALDSEYIFEGMITAASSGQAILLTTLIKALEGKNIYTPTLNKKIGEAFIGAAAAGEATAVKAILENTDIRQHADFTVAITRALVTACEWGHRNVIRLCLEECAEADMIVPKAPTSMLPVDGRTFPPRRRLPQNIPASTQTNALQASLKGFRNRIGLEDMPGYDYQLAESRAEDKKQESLVRLMLGHGCDPEDFGGEHDYPLQIAAKWGNEGVVQALLEAGADVEGPHETESESPIMLAIQRNSSTGFRVALQLLKAEAHVPVCADGSLSPDLLKTIERATGSLKFPDKGFFYKGHRYTSSETAQQLMSSGLAEVVTKIFTRLPCQVAEDRVFGEILHLAAIAGDFSTVKRLIKHGVDVNYVVFPAHSALGAAAEFGSLRIMKALIDAGAKIHVSGGFGGDRMFGVQEPIIKAIIGNKLPTLKLLLDKGADLKLPAGPEPLLLLATQSRNVDIVRTLLLAGMDVKSEESVLITAVDNGSLDIVECLLEFGADTNTLAVYGENIHSRRICSPLYVACENGDTEVARELLKHGADVNFDVGERFGLPLVAAAGHGRLEMVQLLLEYGCSPTSHSKGIEAISPALQNRFRPILEKRDFYLNNSPDNRGNVERPTQKAQTFQSRAFPSAVVSACDSPNGTNNACKILELLLEAIPDLDERQASCSEAMERAAEAQNHGIFEFLLERVPAYDALGLRLACQCGSVKAVQHVLSQGISINSASVDGATPLRIAVAHMHAELVQFLILNGARPGNGEDDDPTPDFYALSAFAIDSYDTSKTVGHNGITVCEGMVRNLIHIAKDSQPDATAYQASLDASLVLACRIGSVELTSLFLEIGARADSRAELPWLTHKCSQSALFSAIDGNHPQILPILFQWPINPNEARTILEDRRRRPGYVEDDSESGWDTVASSPTTNEFQGVPEQELGGPSTATGVNIPFVVPERAIAACLGRRSPLLLQTFLDVAGPVEILEEHIMATVGRSDLDRSSGQTDLEILLKHDPQLAVSENTILTMLDGPSPPRLYNIVLNRSECGITQAMLGKVRDNRILEVLRDYHQTHEVARSPSQEIADPEDESSSIAGSDIEDQFKQASERINAQSSRQIFSQFRYSDLRPSLPRVPRAPRGHRALMRGSEMIGKSVLAVVDPDMEIDWSR